MKETLDKLGIEGKHLDMTMLHLASAQLTHSIMTSCSFPLRSGT